MTQEPHQIPPDPSHKSDPYNPATAVLYGQFVEAAYTMYNANPNNLRPPRSSDFPSGYHLAAWVLMQDFIFESTGPTFYGFIAQSEADPNQFILAIRGTSSWVEWWDDLNAIVLVPFKDLGTGLVGAGFARIYDTLEVIANPTGAAAAESAEPQSLKSAGGFSQQVAALVNRRAVAPQRAEAATPSTSIAVTAHSLGAALATLYVLDNAYNERIHNPTIYTFASPRVGDLTFARAFNALHLTSWRIDNLPDLVPYVPLGFTHVDTLQQYDSLLKVWPSPACWHALTTYLSLIDPKLQPSAACQLPELAAATALVARPAAPELARAAAPAPTTLSIPAGPVTINITINVGARE
ncbi:lipase family protein [Methylocapsa polymorpha]|uniref:Lipase family protein n=1 Tax=Methylocapsa polymorpha TaxID=3080828 RepID=A0ABZ0HQ77_9HYPH|nr:lipase family protein [Methylocapsa sp. RX1]